MKDSYNKLAIVFHKLNILKEIYIEQHIAYKFNFKNPLTYLTIPFILTIFLLLSLYQGVLETINFYRETY